MLPIADASPKSHLCLQIDRQPAFIAGSDQSIRETEEIVQEQSPQQAVSSGIHHSNIPILAETKIKDHRSKAFDDQILPKKESKVNHAKFSLAKDRKKAKTRTPYKNQDKHQTLRNENLNTEPFSKYPDGNKRDRLTAAVLCIIFGFLGAHMFYLGHFKGGIMHIVLTSITFLIIAYYFSVYFWAGGGTFLVILAFALLLIHVSWILSDLIAILSDRLRPNGGIYY